MSPGRRKAFVLVAIAGILSILLWLYISDTDVQMPLFLPHGKTNVPYDVVATEPSAAETTSGYPTPSVSLPQGQRYVGKYIAATDRHPQAIEAFLGIPYARNTTGEGRFRPAVAIAPSKRTFQATQYGLVCPVATAGSGAPPQGEDCLNANVFRPASRGAKLLPVVVYVHGGAFTKGHGTDRNMASFVSFAKDAVIGVSFNYRVGALGFLPSALTAREGVLNLGLRDQQMLFAWVRENIRAFGGDADNITLMGLSAGAHSIGHHLMHYSQPGAVAPFAKAILESGATTARAVFYPTHPRHLVQFRQFLVACGVEGVVEEDVFSALRKLPLERILHATKLVWDKYDEDVTWSFQPVIDGSNDFANSSHPSPHRQDLPILPDLPITMWRKGQHLSIPVLTGFNANEGATFVPATMDSNAEFRAFFANLIPGLNSSDLDGIEALYKDPDSDPEGRFRPVPRGKGRQWARLEAAYGHYAYVCPVLQTAHFLSSSSTPVHVYRYAATGPLGVSNHGDEGPIVGHDMSVLDGFPGLQAVADAMHGAFARFVASENGDPNLRNGSESGGAVEWPVYSSPFRGQGADHHENGHRKDNVGRLLVFGAGNNERSTAARNSIISGSGKNSKKGVPAQVETLSATDMEACRFWWDRVELSEGFGRPR